MKSIIVSAILIVCGIFSAAAWDGFGTVTADLLNVRGTPERHGAVVFQLRRGDDVTVVGQRGDFYEILLPEKAPVYVADMFIWKGRTSQKANLRAAASVDSFVYTTIPAGTPVESLRVHRGDWLLIKPPVRITCYVSLHYIAQKPAPHPLPHKIHPPVKPDAPVPHGLKPALHPEKPLPPKPEIKPQPKPEIKPQPKPEIKPQPKPEIKPQPKPEIKPQPKPEIKPQPQPELKPQPQPEIKPQPKPELKPQPKPELKPQPKPEAPKQPAHAGNPRLSEQQVAIRHKALPLSSQELEIKGVLRDVEESEQGDFQARLQRDPAKPSDSDPYIYRTGGELPAKDGKSISLKGKIYSRDGKKAPIMIVR